MLLGVVAYWLSGTEWGRSRLANVLESLASRFIDGELHIGRLEGSLFTGATVHDVRVTRGGDVVLTIARIDGRYRLRDLISSALVIDDLVLTGARVTVIETLTGWYVDGLQLPDADPAAPPSTSTIRIRSATFVDGEADVRPINRKYDLVAVAAEMSVLIARDITVDVTRFAAREALGGLVVASLVTQVVVSEERIDVTPIELTTSNGQVRGSLAFLPEGVLEARLVSDRVVLTEWVPYIPVLEGIPLTPAMTLSLVGPLRALHVTGPITDTVGGDADVDVIMNLSDPVFTVRGAATLNRFDAAPWAVRPEWPTRLNGPVTFDMRSEAGRGLAGTFAGTLGRSSYAEYDIDRARMDGRVTADGVTAKFDATTYDASTTGTFNYVYATETATVVGELRNGNGANLPAFLELPPLDSDVQGTYTLVARTPDDWTLESVLGASTLEGATLDPGMLANITLKGEDIAYSIKGSVRNLDPRCMAPKLMDEPIADEDWPFTSARVSGDVTIEGAGAITAELMDHRATFSGTLDGDVDDLRLRSVVMSGALAARRLTMSAEGRASGAWEAIQPDGTFTVSVNVADLAAPFSPTFADGTMDVTLGASSVNGVDLTSARVLATATAGLVTITEGKAAGPLGKLDLTGILALGDSGTSDLAYVVDIADLSLLPAQLEVTATGQLRTEGRLTGPFKDPVARGIVLASSLAMNDMSVMSATGEYEVRIPEFLYDRLTGTASAEGTFMMAGGQEWPRGTVRTTFTATQADVTASTEHERAVLDVTAGITTGADAALEITARAFTLTMPGEAWSMRAGEIARLRMTEDRLTIDRLELVKGSERMTMSGALPFVTPATPSTDALRIDAVGVSVAPFITTLLGEERVTGVLNGAVTVTGAVDDPRVASSFVVSEGTADGVPFTTVGGSVNLAGHVSTVDIALDAAERGTASVKGTVPLDPEAAGLDVAVLAQFTDVGVVAPAIPYVVNASGAAQAELRITGSQASPTVNGTATMTNIRFDVPETGVAYRNLNAGMRVSDSVLIVDTFTMEDQDGHLLRVNGRLDVLSRMNGGEVDLRIVAQQFRLLGNRFGDLAVSLDLTGAGTLLAPQMIGSVKIDRGRFEVDRLLQQFTPSTAYVSTSPVPGAVPVDPHAAPVPPSVFAGAALSIDVILPDNVIVRGRGIQTDDGPIGLGDVNLTLGGTLQVMKARGAEASLVGEVNVVRGTYDFQGRRFAIERGSRLRFRGDDYTNPTLEITATREVSGVTVTARIQGTAAAPSLTLSSDPPLDEGDILALVVFNRTINQLGQGEKVSLAARAGSLAAGAVVGPLADSVARALDLDVFEIQTAEAGTVGATVIVGRQVSDKLFVGFRHEFGGEGTNRLTFEYRLTEYLRIVTSVAPGGQPANRSARTETAGIDLIFVIKR